LTIAAPILVSIRMRETAPYEIEIVEDLLKERASGMRPLAPSQVVVALARPDDFTAPECRSVLNALLSDDERQRLARFRFENDRQLFLVAHALLRVALSRHANIEPCAWRFQTGSHGRPEIDESQSRLRFSLSHTRGLAACAIILERDIGLDVEYLTADAPIEVADQFFSPRERSALLCAESNVRATLFLEYWTLKEAYAKARGLGLSLEPHQFSFYKDFAGKWSIASGPPLYEDPKRWQFRSWRAGKDHLAALAIGRSRSVLPAVANDPVSGRSHQKAKS
jgi:4'-phosphopantetheinyl transferase